MLRLLRRCQRRAGVCLLTVAVLSVTVAWAAGQTGPGRLGERFRERDTNGDGQLTPAELPQAALFARLDLNGDGAITRAEAARAVAQGALQAPTESVPSAGETTARSEEPPAAPADRSTTAPIRQGPKRLDAGAAGVGRQIPDLQFSDLDGNRHRLSDFSDRRAVVIALTGTGCPLCLKYAPSLAAIEDAWRDRGVAFIFVNPNASELPERIREIAGPHGFDGPYVRDPEMAVPAALGAVTTTEVFVLDSARTLVYRGAVDDQYGFGYALEAPRAQFLTEALECVLAEREPAVAATWAPGCELFFDDSQDAAPDVAVTWHNRVSRILQANCLECHRTGGIGPMPLETFEQARDYAGMIRSVVERGVMPPWFAAAEPEAELSEVPTAHWANDRSLSEQEKNDLYAWIRAGAPEGDPGDAPLPKTWPDGWLIGEPDAVYEFPEPIAVKATGTMPYQYVTVETHLPDDKWVQAIEVRPGQIDVVHHVIVSLRGGDGEIDERDGYWGVYVPGNSTLVYPEGCARLLPKGATLRFQMHYTPNGTATEDSTRVGILFADEPPQHEVRVAGIANPRIRIPPRDPDYQDDASLTVPFDVEILSFLPHMHLRGKAARYEAITETGTDVLLDIPQYDFNWQLLYQLAEPVTLRQGDTIRFTCWFDNSAENPANPDPETTVRWGPQTHDEMLLGYVEYIVPGAVPGEPIGGLRRAGGATRPAFDEGLFRRLDVDGNGRVTRDEVRERLPGNAAAAGPIFDRLDQDGNGELNTSEFAALPRLRE